MSQVSAAGAAPLVLGLDWTAPGVDTLIGYYVQLLIDNNSNFLSPEQNIIFPLDAQNVQLGASNIGLVTPAGLWNGEARILRDNDFGAVTATGFDIHGGALSFPCDASAWSLPISDTIAVSAAALNTVTGTEKSNLIAVSGSPALTFTGTNGNSSAAVRTDHQQASSKAQFEVTIVSGATTDWGVGLDDGTGNLNTITFTPGFNTNNGIFVEFTGGTQIVIDWNSRANQTSLINTAGTIADGDIFTIVFDETAHTLEVWRTRSGTTTQMGTTATGMPTLSAYWGICASINSTMSATMNYGATTYAKAPGAGVAAFWA